MYILKQIPEDFKVKEIPLLELHPSGEYSYFELKKKNYNTLTAIRIIADKLNIHLKNIGFAGTKDKNAITEQAISIRYIKKEKISKLQTLNNIEVTYIGQGKKPLSLGDLKGNQFKIIVRNLDSDNIQVRTIKKIPNYYGPQRFSTNNAKIGKYIIQKKFQKAIDLIDNKELTDYKDFHPGDFAGALRTLPLKLRRFYIHAYQSKLWNTTVKAYLKTMPLKNEKIPIVGFATKIQDNPVGELIKNIIKKENITVRDFIIKQIPELSEEGTERDLYIKIEKVKIHMDKDERNKGKTKAQLEFTLPKASYATTLIDYLFNPDF